MREKLGSRLGFILLSAGCAIGIGNVWKFPYMVGENGGAIFVLIYLFFLLVMGVPVLTMEFSLGRAAQKSPVKMYQQLEKPGHKWHLHGLFAMFGNYILMMFYTSISGLMIAYFFSTATGKFNGMTPDQISTYYDATTGNLPVMLIVTFASIIIGFVVCSFSLQKGLERITKFMMLALLALIVILAVNSILLENSSEGLKFYLIPNIENVSKLGGGNLLSGFFNVTVNAMNQAFFTLSLGIGSMAIFGSYLDKKRSLLGEAISVSVLDTFVAIMAGLIIFPACLAFDVEPSKGPPLIFETLPNIFNNMPLGQVWGSLFFVFMSFAAFSTVFAVFENIIACTMDMFNLSRKKACFINCILMLVLCVPCILGFNVLLTNGDNPIMNGEDFIVSNVLLPLGSLVIVLFCTLRYGWGWNNFKEEANTGKGAKVKNWMRIYMTFILPIIIFAIFVIGMIDKFL